MAEHYTKNTVSVTAYCKPCKQMTAHNVMGGRLAACQACLKRLEDLPPKIPPAKQEVLF